VLLKIPPYTLTQRLQYVLFSNRIFTIKQDVGIARTLKTQEITFMYKETTLLDETLTKNLCHNSQQKQAALHAYPNKTKQKLKFKGVWNTTTL